ncbi:MAG: capsule assembly Wzi family protein [Cytophagales bacterium]|nr:capsule assembly Wzi family protein [Cytophagales bacterium]
MRTLLILLVLLIFSEDCLSQNILKNNSISIGLSAIGSTNESIPFWLRSNKYGEIPLTSPIGQIQFDLKHNYDSLYNSKEELINSGLGYGLRIIGNNSKENKVKVIECYLSARFKNLESYIGRRKEIFGLVDSVLSSGSYIWSGNAIPIPKFQIGFPKYVSVLGSKNISYKWGISHGFFGTQGKVESFYLHQKFLYAKVRLKPIEFIAGLNHQVQWGGYNIEENIQYPNNFYALFYSILPLKNISKRASETFTTQDALNRVGNQLGTVDLGFNITANQFSLFFYRQSLYEQGGALLRLANIKDGLNGLSVELKEKEKTFSLKKINLEYFFSKNQGKSPILFTKIVAWELENYFIHDLYSKGWTYNDNVIGTPLITNELSTKAYLPNNGLFINNNRISAFHLSALFNYNEHNLLEIKTLFSRNSGILVNRVPILENQTNYIQFSHLIKSKTHFKKTNIIEFSIAFDHGELFANSLGANLSYLKLIL